MWWPVLAGYLLGSIPTGYLICRYVKKIDIRNYGSGNMGSTNVKRVCGSKLGRTVLAIDILKGALSVVVARLAGSNDTIVIVSGLFAILGHNWTVWLKFKGGKGIAATFGVLLALYPPVALTAAVLWYIIKKLTMYVSLASIISIGLTPLWMWLWKMPDIYIKVSFAIALLSIYTHRGNIKRLIEGKEYRADEKIEIKERD